MGASGVGCCSGRGCGNVLFHVSGPGAVAAVGVATPSCAPAAPGAEVVASMAEVFLVVVRLDEHLIMV